MVGQVPLRLVFSDPRGHSPSVQRWELQRRSANVEGLRVGFCPAVLGRMAGRQRLPTAEGSQGRVVVDLKPSAQASVSERGLAWTVPASRQ